MRVLNDMSFTFLKIKTREDFDTLAYCSIVFVYAVIIIISFIAAINFLYKTVNAPFSVNSKDAIANSPRVNRDHLQSVLQKLKGS